MGYSEYELTVGNGGKGISWLTLSVDDDNLLADAKMADELGAGRRDQYTIRKQYRPKNDKPIWVELSVLRYPMEGDLHCCLVIVNPLKNGHQAAAQIASEQMAQVTSKIEELKADMRSYYNAKDDREVAVIALTRLGIRYPKTFIFAVLLFLTLVMGAQFVTAVNGVKEMLGMPRVHDAR